MLQNSIKYDNIYTVRKESVYETIERKEELIMIKAYIELKDFDELKKFHAAASACRYELIIENGTKKINAKSLMGLMCVASKGVNALVAKSNNRAEFMSRFGEFIAN